MSVTPKLGTGCSSLTPLWSGRRATLVVPQHCDLPLLNGYLPCRASRGSCKIQGASPNLWFAVAPALGFRISSFRFPDGPFVVLCGIVCPGALILAATPRRCNRLPDVVFLDLILLPLVSRLATTYWWAWEVPHVFSSGVMIWIPGLQGGGDSLPRLLPGPLQAGRSGTLGSHTVKQGGGTSSSWRLVVWYPRTQLAPSPASLVPLPRFPIRSSVMDWLAVMPVRANLAQANTLPVAAVV